MRRLINFQCGEEEEKTNLKFSTSQVIKKFSFSCFDVSAQAILLDHSHACVHINERDYGERFLIMRN